MRGVPPTSPTRQVASTTLPGGHAEQHARDDQESRCHRLAARASRGVPGRASHGRGEVQPSGLSSQCLVVKPQRQELSKAQPTRGLRAATLRLAAFPLQALRHSALLRQALGQEANFVAGSQDLARSVPS